MSKQDEYRQYATECMDAAKTATNDAVRKQFLDMAKMWMQAAQLMDDGVSILLPPATGASEAKQ
jgi:hypothetical protein